MKKNLVFVLIIIISFAILTGCNLNSEKIIKNDFSDESKDELNAEGISEKNIAGNEDNDLLMPPAFPKD